MPKNRKGDARTGPMLLAALLLAVPVSAAAQSPSKSSSLRLAVRIPQAMHLQLTGHPAVVDVSDADVERGYVVVRGPRVDIVSNHRAGYLVRAELRGAAFASAQVSGLPSGIEVSGSAPAAVPMPSMAGGVRPGPVPVEYTLRLAPGATPGPQPWPVALALEAP